MSAFVRTAALPILCVGMIVSTFSSGTHAQLSREKPLPIVVVVDRDEYDSLVFYPQPRTVMIADRIAHDRLVRRTYYFRTGEPMMRQYYSGGLQTDYEEWYWRNGNLMHLFPYRKGMCHGIAYSFDARGDIVDSALYVEGRRTGFESYDENFSRREPLAVKRTSAELPDDAAWKGNRTEYPDDPGK